MNKKTVVVLTGAGVSAESGLKTFRDEDGLWNGYNVTQVASPEGWKADRKLVQDFYNQRRKEVLRAQPNAAHQAIAALEDKYHVKIITQNIDDLHERAGSTDVLHLHGQIFKMRSEKNDQRLYDIRGDIADGALAEDGSHLRPHVVWFGEAVPAIPEAVKVMTTASIFILVGTSLQVYPAAGLIDFLPGDIPKYIIDRDPPYVPVASGFIILKKTATEGMKALRELL